MDSLKLVAASKIIGRECSTENKEFVICLDSKRETVAACAQPALVVKGCTEQM
jgi:hypothetical protein